MLYFLHGTDSTQSRKKLHELLDTLHKKKPDAELFKMEGGEWDQARFEEFIGGQGLFENKYIVVLDKIFENEEAKERITDLLKELSLSENVFIFIEGHVDAPTIKKIEKYAQKAQKFEEKDNGAKNSNAKPFNIFSLTDAFGRRDKKQLWILYNQAVVSGSEPEEIHGILFWQLKSILIALGSKSVADSGLKPYVFDKASGFARNYSREELQKMSAQFVDIYHNARRGLVEMDVAIEKFILGM